MPSVSIRGTNVHYRQAGAGGAGPAVVLVHAFPLHSGMWDPQFGTLAGRYALVAPDLTGFGASDAPDDPAAYSMDGYADELAGLLDELGLDRVVLGGVSMGGYVAFAFLRRHRARVGALVLADTRPGPDTPEVAERRTKQQRQVAEEGTGPVIEAQLGVLLSDHTRRERPDVVDQTRRLMAANPPAGFVGALEAMKRRPDSTAELAAIEVPTLVVVGEEDPVTPLDVAEDMTGRIPDARLVVVPRAGHLSSLEAPEAFNDAVGAFLADL
jgi:3-oxoadipate enol-lactonase